MLGASFLHPNQESLRSIILKFKVIIFLTLPRLVFGHKITKLEDIGYSGKTRTGRPKMPLQLPKGFRSGMKFHPFGTLKESSF